VAFIPINAIALSVGLQYAVGKEALTMTIMLNDIFRIADPGQYKLHLAGTADGRRPLDEYVADRSDWVDWNEWNNPNRDDWNRQYVFSVMDFYPKPDSWLFGGVFKVLNRLADRYELEEVAEFAKYEGRLLFSFHRYQGLMGRAKKLELLIDQFKVAEIFSERYSGAVFCGYENIDHDFPALEAIFKSEKSDWKTALSNVKGVYLISDKSNGKKYVGSAYGDMGIWSRWACYIGTGHGWNDELVKLITEKQIDYARKNFKLSVLEIMAMPTPDKVVITREAHWKSVLLAREHGYCRN
jgi:hypothetical protein